MIEYINVLKNLKNQYIFAYKFDQRSAWYDYRLGGLMLK